MAITLPKQREDDRQIRLTITSDDERQPTIEYRVIARCQVRLAATPGTIVFGNVRRGTSPARSFQLVLDGAPATAADPIHVVSRGAGFRVERDPNGDDGAYRVTLSDAADEGYLHGEIAITHAPSREVISIPVSAVVAGEVTLAPPVLAVTEAGLREGRSYSVLAWRNDGLPLGALRDAVYPAGVTVTEAEGPRQGRRLTVEIPNSSELAQSVDVELNFANVAGPTRLRIRRPSVDVGGGGATSEPKP